MSGVWGRNITYSIFGESHGKAIGISIDGLPPGIKLDLDYIKFQMKRRAPGRSDLSTQRNEKDEFEFISGYYNERTTGTPLCAIIWNLDQNSKDYTQMKYTPRPSHADYTGNIKYNGFNDYRGGGHFSGRLTAPLVLAGAIAKQILYEKEIVIGVHINQIGNIVDTSFNKVNVECDLLKKLSLKSFPVLNEEKGIQMKELILSAKNELDSVGGVLEAAVINLPAGLGEPFFDSIESVLSHLLFSIPAVKGVEFGEGFNMAAMKGSEANDELYLEGKVVKGFSNNNGGVLGGISNGMPLIFRTVFKPTPSIGKKQRTVDLNSYKNVELEIKGRHDPCILQRAVPVVEAVTAIAILDFLYDK